MFFGSLCALGDKGKLQGDRRTLGGNACYLDSGVVLGGDPMGDRQAQTGTAGGFGTGRVYSVKAVKDFGLLFFRDTYACISDGNFQMGIDSLRGQRNDTAVWRIFDAVFNKNAPQIASAS